MSTAESHPAVSESENSTRVVGVFPLFKAYAHKAVTAGAWDACHAEVLRKHARSADVVYTRWRDDAGNEFPFSPYSRAAHLDGLNFVGTAVSLSPRAHELFQQFSGSIEDRLRDIARYSQTITFLAVDAVTYTRRKSDAS